MLLANMFCLKLSGSRCLKPTTFYTKSLPYRKRSFQTSGLKNISNSSHKLYKSNSREVPNWLKEANFRKKVKEEIRQIETLELYYKNNSRHLFIVRLMAILQGFFWLNLGHLTYSRLGEYNEETGTPELYSYPKRVLGLGVTLLMALCTGLGMFAYAKRMPSHISLLGKSSKLRIETDYWPLSNKVELLDLHSVGARNRLVPGDSELYKRNIFYLCDLKRKKFYMLDLKGKFSNLEILNSLFYKPGAFETK